MSGYPYEFNYVFPLGTTPEFTAEWLMEDGSAFPWAQYSIAYSARCHGRTVANLSQGSGIVVNSTNNTATFSLTGDLRGEHVHHCTITDLVSGRILPIFDGELVGTDDCNRSFTGTGLRMRFKPGLGGVAVKMRFKPGLIPSQDTLAAAVVSATSPALMSGILDTFRASLPVLPTDDSLIPDAGGWYRDGQGFVRIDPKS